MKILCVDDDVDIATLMDNVLSANGHYVTTCNSGADALAAISDNDFNLIFLDLEMPHISGREVIDSLSDSGFLNYNNIVILTANDLEEPEKSKYNNLGIKEVLQKPMSLDGILEVVKKFE